MCVLYPMVLPARWFLWYFFSFLPNTCIPRSQCRPPLDGLMLPWMRRDPVCILIIAESLGSERFLFLLLVSKEACLVDRESGERNATAMEEGTNERGR